MQEIKYFDFDLSDHLKNNEELHGRFRVVEIYDVEEKTFYGFCYSTKKVLKYQVEFSVMINKIEFWTPIANWNKELGFNQLFKVIKDKNISLKYFFKNKKLRTYLNQLVLSNNLKNI